MASNQKVLREFWSIKDNFERDHFVYFYGASHSERFDLIDHKKSSFSFWICRLLAPAEKAKVKSNPVKERWIYSWDSPEIDWPSLERVTDAPEPTPRPTMRQSRRRWAQGQCRLRLRSGPTLLGSHFGRFAKYWSKWLKLNSKYQRSNHWIYFQKLWLEFLSSLSTPTSVDEGQ